MMELLASECAGYEPAKCTASEAEPKSSRSRLRFSLFYEQGAICYWEEQGKCRMPGIPMQLKPYRRKGEGRNPLHASFEHLIPQREGGEWSRKNLRLAHAVCNWTRDKKN